VNIYYKEVGEIACFNHDLTIDAPPVANLIATLGSAIKLQSLESEPLSKNLLTNSQQV
jgi:hypothetical protein